MSDQSPPVVSSHSEPAANGENTVPASDQLASYHSDPPAGEGADGEEEGTAKRSFASRFLLFQAVPSWLVSMVVHAVLLLILAVLSFGPEVEKVTNQLLAVADRNVSEIEEFQVEEIAPVDVQAFDAAPSALDVSPVEQELPEVAVADDLDAAPARIELDSFGEQTAPMNNLLQEIGAVTGSGLAGRGAQARSQMVSEYGGNQGSEKAVAAALAWLAEHQMPDGGWSFNHRAHPRCQGRCSHAGTLDQARNGATAMALLPFLGAGQTHQEGKYKKNVEAGLYFLTRNMKIRNGMGDMTESGGNMYSHGLAAITLCEAYAMTQDKALMTPAQLSLNYIIFAQDPVGGGWRYQPKQPGDTSVVGWQLMALKSGHMGYLQVPPNTVAGAMRFLDSVQADGGARYGYTGPGQGQATTAVGLLCRMYLGWKKENPSLQKGVQILAGMGPSKGNMYYNYYATQVMRQYGGESWEPWNEKMRDFLVESQAKEGHMAGSWYMDGGDHGAERGGRLYCTSMAAMILEVYYRHMPIYGQQASEEEFPL